MGEIPISVINLLLAPGLITCSRGRVGRPLGTEFLLEGTCASVLRLSFASVFYHVVGGFVFYR